MLAGQELSNLEKDESVAVVPSSMWTGSGGGISLRRKGPHVVLESVNGVFMERARMCLTPKSHWMERGVPRSET